MKEEEPGFPVYQAMLRSPSTLGLPLQPLLLLALLTYIVQAIFGLRWALLGVPAYVILRWMTHRDERIFHLLWLYCLLRMQGNTRFWQAASYAPLTYARSRGRLWRRIVGGKDAPPRP